MKSESWDEVLLAEHRSHLRGPDAVEAFDTLVRVAIEMPRYACAPGRHGAIRDFRYDDNSSGERPFAFIVNRNDLLFYVRSAGLHRVSGGIRALKAEFASASENSSGEWTVRIASRDDANRLHTVIFSAYASPDKHSDGIPDGISREDVLGAIYRLDQGAEHSFGPSLKYDLVFEGRRYAPKAVIGLAAERLAGRVLLPGDFSGGQDSKSTRMLQDLGFVVETKARSKPLSETPDDEEDDELDSETQAEQALLNRTDIGPTEKRVLIDARRGQGKYRRQLLLVEPRCRVTGVDDPNYLIASHMKPWSVCSDWERLSEYNGLMLAPQADHLFGNGFIAFTDVGDVLISAYCARAILVAWSISPTMNVGPFRVEQRPFLAYHREMIFQR